MKIAMVQMSPTTGDLHGNKNKIINRINDAQKLGADIVVFPEMSLTGYCISDLVEDDLFVKTNKELINEIASHTKNIIAVIGFIDYNFEKKNNDGRLRKYNAAAVLQNEKIIGIVHKTLLPNYRYFDDKRYFTPASQRKPITVKINGEEVSLGISICEDMWDDDYEIKVINELAGKGADIILNINASPFLPGKFRERERLIKRHISKTHLPFVYVNTVGAADNGKNIIPFDGQSLAYNKKGDLIALANQFIEETILVDTDSTLSLKSPLLKKEVQIFDALVMSLKEYSTQTGFKKAILPLSGGIDSALGLVITSQAFGKDNVIAYNLPSKFNTELTKGIASKLAKNLGVEYKIIPIQEIDEKIKDIFTKNAHTIKSNVAKENIHARIRGILMMLEANDQNSLLISNGNKTEIALGYSTLYGDMCGGISVIGDLSKSDVYSVSKYVNEKFGKEIIPNEVFSIKPSAELSEGQYDPFDYEVVSPIVDLFVEERDSPQEIIEKFKLKNLGSKFKDDVYIKYDIVGFENLVYDTFRLLKRSVYKRLQGPPIIAVTQRSFGFDLRETLINKWEAKNEK